MARGKPFAPGRRGRQQPLRSSSSGLGLGQGWAWQSSQRAQPQWWPAMVTVTGVMPSSARGRVGEAPPPGHIAAQPTAQAHLDQETRPIPFSLQLSPDRPLCSWSASYWGQSPSCAWDVGRKSCPAGAGPSPSGLVFPAPCLLPTGRWCRGTLSPGRRRVLSVLSAHSLVRPCHPLPGAGPAVPPRGSFLCGGGDAAAQLVGSASTVSSTCSGPSEGSVWWPPGGRRKLRAWHGSGCPEQPLRQVPPPRAWTSSDACGSSDCACGGPSPNSSRHRRAASQARGEGRRPPSLGAHASEPLCRGGETCSRRTGNSFCRALPLRPAAQSPGSGPQTLSGATL